MKLTKTYRIFLLTFAIGCFLVFSYTSSPKLKNETDDRGVISFNEVTESKEDKKIESKPKLEVIEDIDNWTDKEPLGNIKLLETGEGFHGEEVKAKSGEKWLGLFQKDDKFILKTTQLKIRRVFDGIVDAGTKNKTGKSVFVKGAIQPLFLINNSNLKSGEINTLFRGNRWEDMPEDSDLSYDEFLTVMKKGFNKDFEINNKKFSLKVIEAQNKKGEEVFALILKGIGKRQVLHTIHKSFSEEGYGLGTLHWIGDLDNDNIPDLYFSPFVHYNVKNRVLLLSSKAKGNNLLEKVAYFWTTGC